MDIHRTEEEQIEVIKKWWQEQGNSVLTTIAITVLIVFGWQYWKNHNVEQKTAASVEYQQLLEAMEPKEAQSLSTEERVTANHLADELKEKYSGTSYARYGALLKAKLAVDSGDLAEAKKELQWVLDQKPSDDLKHITLLRLARVQFALGEDDAALAIVEKDGGAFAAAYAELKGDIYLKKGQRDKAREAYQQSVNIDKEMDVQENRIVEMKLQDLQKANPDELVPAVNSVSDTNAAGDASPANDAAAKKEEKPAG